ncbi:hypothetical protein D3C85_1591420 [compost metagenome]
MLRSALPSLRASTKAWSMRCWIRSSSAIGLSISLGASRPGSVAKCSSTRALPLDRAWPTWTIVSVSLSTRVRKNALASRSTNGANSSSSA